MTEERAKRKLRAILSSDAVGYNRLMQEDQASTIRAIEDSKSLSDDKKEGLIAKGLTEDIITALSRVPGLFVIAGASSAFYEG